MLYIQVFCLLACKKKCLIFNLYPNYAKKLNNDVVLITKKEGKNPYVSRTLPYYNI